MCRDDGVLRRRLPAAEGLSQNSYVNKAGVETQARAKEDDESYVLTRKVVSYHNSANDGWVIYDGGVYDVTMFLESHPGGADVLTERLGEDVTEVMHGRDGGEHVHSNFAMKMLDKYKIGQITETQQRGFEDGNIDPASGEVLVKWDEPILHQVGMLGDKYFKWIHSFPTSDHTVKMFTNNGLEALTKCAWYVPLLFWIPIILYESIHYIILLGGLQHINPILVVTMLALGYICWLLFEYSLHRWIFHWRSSGYIGNIFHFLIHGHHHITPMDFDRLVFPPVPALILAAPFWLGAPRLLGVTVGYPWLIGLGLGYLIYDMTHFWIHHAVPQNPFFKQQKRRHVHHHYFQPSVNFGISNPLFDYVFQTIKEPV